MSEAGAGGSALAAHQTSRLALRIGDRGVVEAEVDVTPLGLLAIGGLVAAIMLSVPPIIRASSEALEARRRARSGQAEA